MDITQLILDDHHEQRRLFAMLEQIDRGDTDSLSALWARLGTFLELHAAAEEEIFYPALLQAAWPRPARPESRKRPSTPSTTTTRSGTRSRTSPITPSAVMTGMARSPRPTWPTVITWPRRSAKA